MTTDATAKYLRHYQGEDIEVTWDKRLCIHVGECGRAQGDLFVSGRDPWCDPDVTGVEDVLEVVKRCPTGALSCSSADGAEVEAAEEENVIVISNNGPLYIRGDLEIDGTTADMPGVKYRVALCRCGKSNNKPFCDNSHESDGFVDRGAVGAAGDGCDEVGGTLKVTKLPDGPLLLQGNFVIIASSGREAFRGTKAALCRCGASKNKPFCDGAHRDIGFTDG